MGKEKSEADQKKRALSLILDAWDNGLNEGVDSVILAEVAIYAALTDLVAEQGEEAIAQIFEELPKRIRAGEFTLEEDGSQ